MRQQSKQFAFFIVGLIALTGFGQCPLTKGEEYTTTKPELKAMIRLEFGEYTPFCHALERVAYDILRSKYISPNDTQENTEEKSVLADQHANSLRRQALGWGLCIP